jgi:septal ring factor EnvC (AmiA/AmiB activator)
MTYTTIALLISEFELSAIEYIGGGLIVLLGTFSGIIFRAMVKRDDKNEAYTESVEKKCNDRITEVQKDFDNKVDALWDKIHELKDADAKHRETQAKLEAKLEGIEKRLEKIPDQATLTSILASTLTSTLTGALGESEKRLERYVDRSLRLADKQ